MHELKFRVWSKKQKTYDYEHPFNKPGDFYINQDGVLFSDFGNSIAPKLIRVTLLSNSIQGSKMQTVKRFTRGMSLNTSLTSVRQRSLL